MTELATEPPLTSLGSLLLKRREQSFLFVEFDEPHGAAFEAELGEFCVVDFDEDVDDGVAQAAELEFFHGRFPLCSSGNINRCMSAMSTRRLVSSRPRIARLSNTPGPTMTPVVATRKAWFSSPILRLLASQNALAAASRIVWSNGPVATVSKYWRDQRRHPFFLETFFDKRRDRNPDRGRRRRRLEECPRRS